MAIWGPRDEEEEEEEEEEKEKKSGEVRYCWGACTGSWILAKANY